MIKHRGETRGLGGIFFDDLNDGDPEKIFGGISLPLGWRKLLSVPKLPPSSQRSLWVLLR